MSPGEAGDPAARSALRRPSGIAAVAQHGRELRPAKAHRSELPVGRTAPPGGVRLRAEHQAADWRAGRPATGTRQAKPGLACMPLRAARNAATRRVRGLSPHWCRGTPVAVYGEGAERIRRALGPRHLLRVGCSPCPIIRGERGHRRRMDRGEPHHPSSREGRRRRGWAGCRALRRRGARCSDPRRAPAGQACPPSR